jgi:hypothetical protein
LKKWIKMTKGGATVGVRDLAKLIGQLSATRAQHEQASLYLAKMNRLKCSVVRAGGWDALVQLAPARTILTELSWWLRTVRANVANSIKPFDPAAVIHTDASEIGWGGSCVVKARAEERWMYDWWRPSEAAVNCIRELRGCINTVKRSWHEGLVKEGSDVLVRTDNTNVEYNVNKKRAGVRMRKMVKEFLQWLDQKQIRVQCKHIPGVRNEVADALSRLSKSGDYSLRPGMLARAEEMLGEAAEVDLLARRQNAQKRRYCTLEKRIPKAPAERERVLARNAMDIPWTDWTGLIHPPIPMITRVLLKIQKEQARALVILPHWQREIRAPLLRSMTVKGPVILGNSGEVLQMGPSMAAMNATLPPGNVMALIVQGNG